jgi:hypothetical protein
VFPSAGGHYTSGVRVLTGNYAMLSEVCTWLAENDKFKQWPATQREWAAVHDAAHSSDAHAQLLGMLRSA